MTNPSDEEPKVDLGKPAEPQPTQPPPPAPTQPMYGQSYGQGYGETHLPPTHSAYGEDKPTAPTNPYGQASSFGQPTISQTQSYGSGQSPYGQNPAPTPAPMPYGAPYGQTGVQDSSATTAMVLGIVGLAGFFVCFLPAFLAPVALFMGAAAKRRIDASGGALRGRGEAQAGFVMGLIGTILLVLGILFVIVLIIISVTAASHDPSYSPSDDPFNSDF